MSPLERLRADLNKIPLDEVSTFPPRKVRKWRAVLGRQMEYADTGFIIVLQTGPKKQPFALLDPDGRLVGESDRLPCLKEYAEQQATWRDEFEPVGSDLSSLPDFNQFK